jgi:arylamine N-acetyltransferase
MVEVHHEEGVATHLGPESCVFIREDAGEASTGERTGQPLSRETNQPSGVDAFQIAEDNTDGRISASARTTRRGRRPWHVRTLLEREPGDLASDQWLMAAGPHREGEEP